MVTVTVWEGRLAGEFHGYACHTVYQLGDGSSWKQVDDRRESVYRENPMARLLYEKRINVHWLDVDGTSSWVEVRKHGPRRPKPEWR